MRSFIYKAKEGGVCFTDITLMHTTVFSNGCEGTARGKGEGAGANTVVQVQTSWAENKKYKHQAQNTD